MIGLYLLLIGPASSLVALALGRHLSVGTRSVLYGAHCWWIHPWFVALGWWRLYGFRRVTCSGSGVSTSLLDPRLWVSFAVHDLGYLGKPNMDGPEGEEHPELGAKIMGLAFDYSRLLWMENGWGRINLRACWYDFSRYHSRFLAKRDGQHYSLLCIADKQAIAETPSWMYVPMVRATGEISEYRKEPRTDTLGESRGWRRSTAGESDWSWHRRVRSWCAEYAAAHRDGQEDGWTPRRAA